MSETQNTTTAEVEVNDGMEIYHQNYNLDQKDNLDQIPEEAGIFGVFSLVRDTPSNCRIVKSSENLRQSVRLLFENAEDTGVRKFMQGPWIKYLKYQSLDSENEQIDELFNQWTEQFEPKVDEEGEYPGYYEY